MAQENNNIVDFALTVANDVKRIRQLIKNIRLMLKKTRLISCIWSYISILLFAFYAFYQGKATEAWTLSYIIFGVCFAMLIANTVLLCMDAKHREQALHVRRWVFHLFHWITAILKIAMTVIVVYGLVMVGTSSSLAVRIVTCLLSVFWLGVTLTIDIFMLAFAIVIRRISKTLQARKKQAIAAVGNAAAVAIGVAANGNPAVIGAVWGVRRLIPVAREKIAAFRKKRATRKKEKKQLKEGTSKKQKAPLIKQKKQKFIMKPKATQKPKNLQTPDKEKTEVLK